MLYRHPSLASLLVAALFLTSSCLKTRAQLKGERSEDEEDRRPQPAQVQNVEPQGGYALDEVKSEITRLTGRIEDLERAQKLGASQATGAQKEETRKLETRIAELESAQANLIEAVKKLEQGGGGADPSALLEKAKKQYQEQEFEEAIESFDSYLKSPKAKKTEEATFLRAESYFQLKQYKKAIVDYSKFPEKYTRSERMPAVLYRIGQSFDALGMKEDAQGFYQELKEKFPKSAEAKRLSGSKKKKR